MEIPAGMTIDGAGRIVIVDPFGFDITILKPSNGQLIAKYGAPGTVDGQFVYPSDVSYAASHDWFAVADDALRLLSERSARPLPEAAQTSATWIEIIAHHNPGGCPERGGRN